MYNQCCFLVHDFITLTIQVKSNLASKRQNVHKGVFERITKATSLPPLAQVCF